eukprot:TRINITY_DN10466_c1_g2_i1.p1 TRINITY_DN10466_c1_g2~~TRINITY_DN10466_c1_g2_i1.p1  ORF type:complete len:211 (+),score=41.41 TRINITY_DN10466_c1_g2_i1:196-828(+)
MANLILPFTIWSGAAPKHPISSILLVPPLSIITGSQGGHVCLWSISERSHSRSENTTPSASTEHHAPLHVRPRLVMAGHQATVTALASVLYDLNEAVVSVCSAGTVCVWDASDGLCLAASSSRLLEEYSPTSITALPDRRHIVVAGNHTDVVVLDIWKMSITSIIRGHNDWVSGVFPCSLRVSDEDPVVLSLSADGVLRFWSVGIGVQSF